MSDMNNEIISRVKKLIKDVEETEEKVDKLFARIEADQAEIYALNRELIVSEEKVKMWEILYKNMNTRMMN